MFILLDIDGVMTPGNTWRAPKQLEDGFSMFTDDSVTTLNSLLSPSDRVVLTTSHRERFTTEGWKRVFALRGIQIQNLELISEKYEFRKLDTDLEREKRKHSLSLTRTLSHSLSLSLSLSFAEC